MKILVLPGDGIGAEITQSTLAVLDRANAKFKLGLEWVHDEMGEATLKKEGPTLPARVLETAYGTRTDFIIVVGDSTPDHVAVAAEVLALARDYPNLYLQVRLQLVRANLKRDDVSCAARSLPASLGKLAGTAVAPYSCTIGKRTVEITARQTFYDANGHKLGSAAASMAKAVRVAQANLTWRWR